MKYIIGNWKVNPAKFDEAKKLFSEVKKISKQALSGGVQVAVCPPYIYTSGLVGKNNNGLIVGGQDVGLDNSKSETGIISAAIAKAAGISFAIVGHSECRRRGDTNEIVSKKLLNIVSTGLTAVLCVGENKRDHDGLYFNEVATQIRESISHFPPAKLKNLIIAYEPVWAIGENAEAPATPHDFYEMAMLIRRTLSETFDKKASFEVPLLYGGSVDKKNAQAYIDIGADGLLIGRTSLKAKDFISIIEKAKTTKITKK